MQFKVVLKVPMIVIMRFVKNIVLCPKYIDIYEFRRVWVGHTWSNIHFLFIIQKNGKSIRAWPILKSNYTSFWFLKKFPRMNNKKNMKMGPHGAPLLFLYKVSIVVLIDIIAKHLTLGIFLIQIVNTNNTNMYLIHFHSKNIIKMIFHKNWVFKVSKLLQTFIISEFYALQYIVVQFSIFIFIYF